MPATTGQVAPAQEAGRPQPQTTVEPPGGPFVRHSQPGRRIQYALTGNAFGATITQPLVACPGYVARFRLRVAATGGSGGAAATVAADAPFNAIALVTLRDAFGTPLLVGPGWHILYLVPKYSGQFGLFGQSELKNFVVFAAVTSASGVGEGNFTFATALPLEFAKAYGLISMANASLLPTLTFNIAASTTVYTANAPGTLPVMEFDLDADFYWLPEGVAIEPPGLGTTCQWVFQTCNPTIGSQASIPVTLPRLGGFLHTIILELRDSTGARIDAYGTRFRIYVDGVPLIDSRFDTIQDDMQIQMAGVSTSMWTRDTGVLVISRRTSLSQVSLGLLDTGEVFLSTNPGTLVQIECSPWGTISNAPGTLNAVVGQVVPAGSLLQGLPEL